MTKLCECGCGNPAPIARDTGQPGRFISGHNGHKNLLHGQNKTHGMGETPEYFAYMNAKKRCTNDKDKRWKDYGGRGIKFNFSSFEEFFAVLGRKPSPAHSLDRKENDGHYEPGNVRWATPQEQRMNQRPAKKAA
jgi:hypothetical protein